MSKKLIEFQKKIAARNLAGVRASLANGVLEGAPLPDRARALHTAITTQDSRIVLQLLENGVDPNLRWDGVPMLIAAIRAGPADNDGDAIIQHLLARGADVSSPDPSGWIPIKVAAWEGKVRYVEDLLRAGADPSVFTSDGRPDCLTMAVFRGHLDVARVLLQRFPRQLAPQLLHLAARSGDLPMVTELLNASAPVNGTDGTGTTALMAAVSGTSTDDSHPPATLLPVVEALLLAGANANARDRQGRQALDLAREAGHVPIITLLSEWTEEMGSESPV